MTLAEFWALAVRLGFAKPTQATKKAKGGALPRG